MLIALHTFFACAMLPSAVIDCPTAIVGGGWAGVYAAWRLAIDAASVPPTDVCLFEARASVGGRTYSVTVDGMVVDIGAYRFGKGMHLPGDLIINKLKLPIACYAPSCSVNPELNQTLYRVVDAHGHNAGYVTPVRMMAQQLSESGVRIYYRHKLTGIYDEASGEAHPPASRLHFAGGAVARAGAVLLNLPRVAITRLDPASVLFGSDPAAPPFQILRNCSPCMGNIGVGNVGLGVKVYALYDDPWWLTKLGLTEGTFTSVDAQPPLVGRYHDGPVTRDAGGHPIGPGALEAVYTFSFAHPQVEWFVPFAANPSGEPLTLTTDPALLGPMHARLMAYHAAAFAKKSLNASKVPPMAKIALGLWTSDQFATLTNPASANLNWMIGKACPAESCLQGVTPTSYNALVGTPNPARNIHIANNDFTWTGDDSVPCCWAEQSLKSVERTLHKAWQLPPPEWLNMAYWQELITE